MSAINGMCKRHHQTDGGGDYDVFSSRSGKGESITSNLPLLSLGSTSDGYNMMVATTNSSQNSLAAQNVLVSQAMAHNSLVDSHNAALAARQSDLMATHNMFNMSSSLPSYHSAVGASALGGGASLGYASQMATAHTMSGIFAPGVVSASLAGSGYPHVISSGTTLGASALGESLGSSALANSALLRSLANNGTTSNQSTAAMMAMMPPSNSSNSSSSNNYYFSI